MGFGCVQGAIVEDYKRSAHELVRSSNKVPIFSLSSLALSTPLHGFLSFLWHQTITTRVLVYFPISIFLYLFFPHKLYIFFLSYFIHPLGSDCRAWVWFTSQHTSTRILPRTHTLTYINSPRVFILCNSQAFSTQLTHISLKAHTNQKPKANSVSVITQCIGTALLIFRSSSRPFEKLLYLPIPDVYPITIRLAVSLHITPYPTEETNNIPLTDNLPHLLVSDIASRRIAFFRILLYIFRSLTPRRLPFTSIPSAYFCSKRITNLIVGNKIPKHVPTASDTTRRAILSTYRPTFITRI